MNAWLPGRGDTHFKGNIENETNKSKQESATNNELRSATGKQITEYNLSKKEQQNETKQRERKKVLLRVVYR